MSIPESTDYEVNEMKDKVSVADIYETLAPLNKLTGTGIITKDMKLLNECNPIKKHLFKADYSSENGQEKKLFVIDGHPITALFSSERQPETYYRVRNILLSNCNASNQKGSSAP